jgi:hydrogenase-1 operon protein HyaF
MNEVDMAFLKQTLNLGPVQAVSRGYGTCRVTLAGQRHVWSVQYLNAMDIIILDTLEVGDVPVSLCAADEDFQDSAERLGEILEAYFQ